MAIFTEDLNEDQNGVKTTGEFGNPGDGGVDKWYHFFRTSDGGNAALGATTDGAINDPVTNGTLVAFTRGILTQLVAILAKLTVGTSALLKAEDAPHATGDAGVMMLAVRKATAAASSGSDLDYEPVQTDALGRLRVVAKRDSTDALSVVHMAALAAAQVVKGSAGTLHSIVGYVASGEDGWIQVHDATAAPGGGAVPEITVFVGAASAHVQVNIPLPGHVCGTGITLAWSTTGPTHTAGSAKMMVAAHYE